MGINSYLTDPATGKRVGTRPIGELGETASLSKTDPYVKFRTEFRPFLNPSFGNSMNQNIAFSGVPDKVHNGTDSAEWTASAISGTWDFASTTQAQSGTKSVDATATVNGDIAEFDRGSDLTLSGFTALTGWIYITAWSTVGTKQVIVFGYDTNLATAVSVELDLADFIDISSFNVWMQFVIPLADFGFTQGTLDALRVRTVDIGGQPPPSYFLDDIQFEQFGDPAEFKLEIDEGETLWVHRIRFTIADTVSSTLADGAGIIPLSYDQILGVASLSAGMTFKRVRLGETRFSITFRQLSDFTGIGFNVMNQLSDATKTMISLEVEFKESIILSGSPDGNFLSFTVNDDLSGLDIMSALCIGSVEIQDREEGL